MLTINTIACDFLDLKSELSELSQGPKCEQLIIQTAIVLHNQVRNEMKEQFWPPKPDELTEKYIVLGQDILYAVTNAQVIRPKLILLPWVIKALSGDVELIHILNRIGHGCSYSHLEGIDTALCIEKLSNVDKGAPLLPLGTHPLIPTVLACDNIDAL